MSKIQNNKENHDQLLEEYISRLEQKYVSQAHQLKTITDNIASSLFLVDKSGRPHYMNPSATYVTGYKLDEIKKRKLYRVLHKSHVNNNVSDGPCDVLTSLKNLQPIKDYEDIFVRKDGSSFPVSVSLAPLEESGKSWGAVVEFQDITRRKELERQKDEFLGVASHELKTPVTSIKAYAQVLQFRFTKKQDLESAELIGKMDQQLDKLSNLISDLLDVTKIQGGRLLFHEAAFDFNDLVDEIVDEIQRTSDSHKIIKNLGKSVIVYADRDRTGQVLTNFLTNAIKYSPLSKRIIVSTNKKKNMIQICVKDYGVGISQEKKDHVFERFYRISGPAENTFPGLGLGLYISSEIVKRQRGKIWVDSQIGKGSNFCFSLPIYTKIKKRK